MGLYICIMIGILVLGRCRFRFEGDRKFYGTMDLIKKNFRAGRREHKSLVVLFFCVVFWCLTSLKGSAIGSDTGSYIRVYLEAERWVENANLTSVSEWFSNSSRFETGYVILNRLIAFVFNDRQWLFIIISTFCFAVFYNSILEDTQDVILTLFLFVSLRFLYFLMSGLRQAIAMYICVLAMACIKKRKLIPFCLLVSLAAQFHITALVFLVAYPASCMKFTRASVTAVTIVGIVIYLLFDVFLGGILGILPEYYAHYTETVRFAENKLGNILVALIQLIFLLVAYFSDYGEENRGSQGIVLIKEYDEASFMKFMILISFLLSIISLRATTMDRLYYYFWIFSLIYIPNVLCGIRNRKNRRILSVGTVVFTFLYNITLLYFRPEWNNITPYVFFWQE